MLGDLVHHMGDPLWGQGHAVASAWHSVCQCLVANMSLPSQAQCRQLLAMAMWHAGVTQDAERECLRQAWHPA